MGSGCSLAEPAVKQPAKSPKPYLKEYFAKVEKHSQNELKNLSGGTCLDAEALEEHRRQISKNRSLLEKETEGLLQQAFNTFDRNGNGVLCPEEANCFFQCLVDESTNFIAALMSHSAERAIERGIRMANESAEVTKEEVTDRRKSAIMMDIGKEVSQIHRQMQEGVMTYRKNKEANNAKAFDLLDTDKNGTLKLDEFLDAFNMTAKTPGTMQSELLGAFGIQLQTPDFAKHAEETTHRSHQWKRTLSFQD